MHDVNNCLQFVFVMSISDQTVSSKPVIFDRKIVLGQNTIHKDCISYNKVRFSAESKYPYWLRLPVHVSNQKMFYTEHMLSTKCKQRCHFPFWFQWKHLSRLPKLWNFSFGSRSAKGGEKGDPNRNPWLAKMMLTLTMRNNLY
jgi:hypothetical protein